MLGTISGLDWDKQIIHREMTNKTLESKPLKTLGGKRDVCNWAEISFLVRTERRFLQQRCYKTYFNLDGNIPEETDRL
jgi:hypothetical protein